VRRVPLVVWVLVALNGALLCLYSLLFPPYTGFDEPQHVDMVIHVARGETWPWPAPGALPLSLAVANSSNPVYFGPISVKPYTNDVYPNRGNRKTIRELGVPAPTVHGVKPVLNFPNQMVQHPPAYYALDALVLKAWPGNFNDMPYDEVVSLLRLLSIVLVAPLPLLVWNALDVVAEPPVAVTGAVFSIAVPGLTRVGSNVQNDNLLILAVSALLVALLRVGLGDLTTKTAVAVGSLTALALFTKGFALVLPPVVLAAYALHHQGWRLPWKPLIYAVGIGGVLGGPWYLMNIIRFGHIQTEGLGKAADKIFRMPPNNDPHPLGGYVTHTAGLLNRRFWGAIGITDKPSLPLALGWALTIAVTGLVVRGVVVAHTRRGALCTVLLPVPLMLGLIVAGSIHWWHFNGQLPGVQGRYLYPGMLGTIVVVSIGLCSLLGSRANLGPMLAFVAFVVLQVWALEIIFRSYWMPGHDVDAGLHGIFHWSPWPPVVTALPVLGVAFFGVWAFALVLGAALRPSDAAAPTSVA
jgi:small subunit ribosomal protein S36